MSSKKGDAVYETSNNINGSYSWNGDYSYMPATGTPWFGRGGNFYNGSSAGSFYFHSFNGAAASRHGFVRFLSSVKV